MSVAADARGVDAGVSDNRAADVGEETKRNGARLAGYQSIRMITKIPIDDQMTKFAWQRI